MKNNILNYRILIEKAVNNTEKAIKIYLKTLSNLGRYIPKTDSEDYTIVNKKIIVDCPIAFA